MITVELPTLVVAPIDDDVDDDDDDDDSVGDNGKRRNVALPVRFNTYEISLVDKVFFLAKSKHTHLNIR